MPAHLCLCAGRTYSMRTILTLLCAALALALVGCSGGNSVVGKWEAKMSSTDPEMSAGLSMMPAVPMEFMSDGNYTVSMMGMEEKGTYKQEGNKVMMTSNEKTVELTMSEDGKTMTGTDSGMTMTMTRVEDSGS